MSGSGHFTRLRPTERAVNAPDRGNAIGRGGQLQIGGELRIARGDRNQGARFTVLFS
jgi:hypothetical protein